MLAVLRRFLASRPRIAARNKKRCFAFSFYQFLFVVCCVVAGRSGVSPATRREIISGQSGWLLFPSDTWISPRALWRQIHCPICAGPLPPNHVPTYGPIPIFPSLPYGYPVNVEIEMDTTLGTTKSLREMRAPQQQYPLWNIEIPLYELLDQTQNQIAYAPFTGYQQYQNLVQLWLMMYGQTGVFGFDCPWDDSRANQYLGFGDGTTYIFQLYRTWGIGATATTAPVGLVNTVSQVSVGGTVISPTQYFAARDKLYFQDSSGNTYPPGLGQNVLITFSYYYLCRFVEDEQDFEEFAKNRWTVPSLKFQAVLWI